MSVDEAYEEMMKSVPAQENPKTEEEAKAKPGDDVTSFMQGLAAKFFKIHGDITAGTAGSEFFVGFLAKSAYTPWFRWCKQQDPPLRYKLSEDKWYKIFGNMIQSRNGRKRKADPAAPVPNKVAKVACVDAVDAVEEFELAELRKEHAALLMRFNDLEKELGYMETRLTNADRGIHTTAIKRDEKLCQRITRLEACKPKGLLSVTKVLPVGRKRQLKKAKKAPEVVQVGNCMLLPVTASYCQLLPVTASYYQLLPVTACYCQLLPVTTSYCQLLPVTVSNSQYA
jgi:hypothetical protein